MASAAVSSHGGRVGPCDDAPHQGWSCARRAGSWSRPLRGRASIQRRLMPPELPAVEIASPELLPSIGTSPVHGPMVLDAADSTVGGMLSLNVNVSRWRGGASPSRSCALVMNCGAGTMQEDHTRSLLKSQGSSRSCRQDTALGVHYGRNVVVAWKRSPVAVPGRDRRFRQSHPTVSCSPCHVHHKSVGGRLLKTRPWPATRKRYNLSDPRLHHVVGHCVSGVANR